MIPMRLDWQRPLDAAELVYGDDEWSRHGVIRARSDRFAAVSYEVTNLEDALCVRLVNADSAEKLVSFVTRFGVPDGFPKMLPDGRDNRESVPLRILEGIRLDLWELLSTASIDDPMARISTANKLLKFSAIRPSLEYFETDGKHRLFFRPDSLADFMAIESAVALDVGATMTRCAHCSTAFLVGPLTGRRSHATYCSDRCRVAAMRARNAAKEA